MAQHTKATLQSEFLDVEPSYKVKMIAFSPKHGAPTPLLRRIATDHARDVSVARVLYKPSDASFWTKQFGLVRTCYSPHGRRAWNPRPSCEHVNTLETVGFSSTALELPQPFCVHVLRFDV